MACVTPFDVLKARAESLSETLYVRASWKDPWLNLIPRESYPKGAGYERTAFTIGRSEPATDEETWVEIAPISQGSTGACAVTYNQTYVGHHEDPYQPEVFGLVGPLMCQSEFEMNWNSAEFWEKYFQALEKRNKKSISNRLANVYMQYSSKASANSSFTYYDGDVATQSPPAAVTMTDLDGANLPTSELTQEMLDDTARILGEEGADEPNSNGWITQGPDGSEYPLYIGQWMSHRLLLNNSELRSDFNNAFSSFKTANPVIQRLGASRVIKNFRHIINRFPPRWRVTNDLLVRVPTWVMSTDAADATKGRVAVINPDWRDPAIAVYEGATVMTPWVMTEEVITPTGPVTGMNWKPQNYFGEWKFVTGNDAVLGFDSCTGITDPLHKQGRHFAEYRHALRPKYPVYGRFILYKRCADSFDLVTCS